MSEKISEIRNAYENGTLYVNSFKLYDTVEILLSELDRTIAERDELQKQLQGVGVEKYYTLQEKYQELKREIESHAPDGRNYTNGQYVSMREKYNQAIEALKGIKEIVDSIPKGGSKEGRPDYGTMITSDKVCELRKLVESIPSLQED